MQSNEEVEVRAGLQMMSMGAIFMLSRGRKVNMRGKSNDADATMYGYL
jgi:hypothetical protein